jgi:phospholipase/carboxylesterase
VPNLSKGSAIEAQASNRNKETGKSLLTYIEVLTTDAKPDEILPMVIVVHGLGDTPENFKELYETLPNRCRVIIPRAFISWRMGYSWFDIDLPYAERGKSFSDDVAFAAKRVAALIEHLLKTKPTSGKPIVSGFSQGGMISFTLAVNHPEVVSLAIPIGGALPAGIEPRDSSAIPPIRALHGTEDAIVPAAFARSSISRLKKKGLDAALVEYPGVPHAVSEEMRQALFREIAEHLKKR